MKNFFRRLLIAAYLFIAPIILLAQQPPHPNGGVNGPGGGPVGGGAPIGDGIYFMVAFALVYGISRWYAINKPKAVQE